MKIAVFAKKGKTEDGKTFDRFIGRITKKDGEEITVSIRFRDECGQPKYNECPMNIIVDKANANLTKRSYTREDTGEVCTAYTLWITAWSKGEKYVDHSLDDFEG